MLLFSVIGREFREAARRKRVHGLRLIFGVAMAVWFCTVALRHTLEGVEALGAEIYDAILLPLVYGLMLVAPALAAPSIAMERKADTLGLLFLTRLRPVHIVLAKFSARVVELLWFVLLALPFLALPIWFGGVERDQVINNGLHLFGLLLLTTAIGLCVSAFFQSSVVAFITSMGVLFVVDLVLQYPSYLQGFQTRPGASFWVQARDAFLFNYEPFMGLFTTDELWFRNLFMADKILAGLAVLVSMAVASVLLLGIASWRVARVSRHPSVPFSAGWITRLRAANRIGNRLAAFGAVGLVAAALYGYVPGKAYFLQPALPFAQLLAANFILLVFAAQSIASEKETGTLETLLCTPLPAATILNRKLSMIWANCWGWYLLLTIHMLILVCHGSGWFTAPAPRLIAWLLYMLGLPIAASVVGLFCSAYSKTIARAVVASIVAAAVLFQLSIFFLWVLSNTSWWRSAWQALNIENVFFGSFGIFWIILAAGLYLILLKRFRQFATRL